MFGRTIAFFCTFLCGIAAAETDAQRKAAGYALTRAGLVVNAQPDLSQLLKDDKIRGAFKLNATDDKGSFDLVTSGHDPGWVRMDGGWSEVNGNRNSYFHGVAGTNYYLSRHALTGLMLQFDRLRRETTTTETFGDGFLAGPFIVAKLPNQPLYLEGSYLLGRTDDSMSSEGNRLNFSTLRGVANAKVSGEILLDDLTLTPSIRASHVLTTLNEENQEAHSATAQKVTFGLDFSKPLQTGTGEFLLTGGVSGIHSASRGDHVTNHEHQRARVYLSGRYTMENGMDLEASASRDGIGTDRHESWGVKLGVAMRF